MLLERVGIGFWFAIALLLVLATQVDAGDRSAAGAKQAKELGEVAWLRDYDAATQLSRETKKPVFLLFQEVPGCATCQHFGRDVLSHPRLIEAIEDEFVPLAILNNVGGHDRQILQRFREPAWNNPVVRFVDAEGADLIPRRDRVWTAEAVARRMIASLEASGRTVPPYLAALRDELAPARIERATLTMACYWEGQACLGGIDGLLSSRAAHLGGREVVEVRYDAARLSYASLLRQARRTGCADGVFAHDATQLDLAKTIYGPQAFSAPGVATDASARDQLFHLKRVPALYALEATPAERLRLNHAVWKKRDPRGLLSPRQRAALQ